MYYPFYKYNLLIFITMYINFYINWKRPVYGLIFLFNWAKNDAPVDMDAINKMFFAKQSKWYFLSLLLRKKKKKKLKKKKNKKIKKNNI